MPRHTSVLHAIHEVWIGVYKKGSGKVDSKDTINYFFTWDGYDAVVDPLGKTPTKTRHNGIGAVAVFSDKGQILGLKYESIFHGSSEKLGGSDIPAF